MSELLHNLITTALHFIEGLGVWGILLGLALEVIPSEIVLAYGGFLVSRGQVSLVGAIVFGTIGCMLQQLILYGLGRYGGRPVLDKFGKYLHLKKKHLDIAENWFNRYGPGMVFLARFVPVLRQAISIPAGMARMPVWKFLFFTLLGTIPWAILFVYLGQALGDNWEQIDEVAAPYVKPSLYGAIALALLYFVWKWLILRAARRREGSGTAPAAPAKELSDGEHATAHQLKYIGGEYRILHGLRVKGGGSQQQIGHIVIGPNGVFHIESNHASGEIRFDESSLGRAQTNALRDGTGEAGRQDPTVHLYRHERVLKELLKEHKLRADVVGIVCFTHPDSQLIGSSPAFATLKADRLVQHIKTYRPTRTLSPADVASIERLITENSQ
ncbi:hypothetical protein GNP93_15860 [Paenibacillus validus]|uniref:NERD domain-containing protein n=1 Tax=Paenibacillus validus TaxID=44253 RepID=A0A7X2ZBX5_9BACL|nr:hypothetical protein [Paenibacillus validus]